MDQQFDFRALLVKLQDCLSDNDRRRLHFIVGDTIPRHLRDDPTLGGTLSLLESLFDRAKISEQDFDYLIQAFREIHCYEAVKRLKEHQQAQLRRENRSTTVSTNVSDLLDDIETDKISPMNPQISSHLASSNRPEERDSTSRHNTTVIHDTENLKKDEVYLMKTQNQSNNGILQIDKSKIKQLFHSRLTKCQMIFFILNFIAIIVFILLIIFFSKIKHIKSEAVIIKIGAFYGNIEGGEEFNDATDCELTFNDKIEHIAITYSSTTLNSLTFYYSNGKSKKHGQELRRELSTTTTFKLNSNENINGVSIYTGTRLIENPFSPNGSYLAVGIRFYTTNGRDSGVLGSSNGTKTDEVITDFTIAYARGRALGYIDGLQFIWYRKTLSTDSAALPTYQY